MHHALTNLLHGNMNDFTRAEKEVKVADWVAIAAARVLGAFDGAKSFLAD